MARKRNSRNLSAPKYRLHKPTGQAAVTINGKHIYLGKYGSDASREKYRRLIANPQAPTESPAGTCPSISPVTISETAVHYAEHAQKYYRKNGRNTPEFSVVKATLKPLRRLYGSAQVAEFGPIEFKAFRDMFINRRLTRKTINHYMFVVKSMFKLAAVDGLIPSGLYWRIRDIQNLQRDRRDAKENDPVGPVDDAVVEATLPELSNVVADMARIQRWTAMRPCEVSILRPCVMPCGPMILNWGGTAIPRSSPGIQGRLARIRKCCKWDVRRKYHCCSLRRN
jgi:hypothetical protein